MTSFEPESSAARDNTNPWPPCGRAPSSPQRAPGPRGFPIRTGLRAPMHRPGSRGRQAVLAVSPAHRRQTRTPPRERRGGCAPPRPPRPRGPPLSGARLPVPGGATARAHLGPVVDQLVHAARAERGANRLHNGLASVDVADELGLALARVSAILEQDDGRAEPDVRVHHGCLSVACGAAERSGARSPTAAPLSNLQSSAVQQNIAGRRARPTLPLGQWGANTSARCP